MGRVVVARRAPVNGPQDPPAPPPPPPPPPPGMVMVPQPWTPYDWPADAEWDALGDTNPVAIHYMANWRRRVYNRNPVTDPASYEVNHWYPPGDQEGTSNHGIYGGLWRTGPASVAPDPASPVGAGSSDTQSTVLPFELNDKVWELQQAKAAGLRHVTVDILSGVPGNFRFAKALAQAADIVGGITLVAMPDCGASIVRNGPTNLGSYLQQLFTGPYAHVWMRHTDGRFLVMPYGPETAISSSKTAFTDQQLIDYWKNWSTDMVARKIPSALWCCFTRAWEDPTEHTSTVFSDPQLDGIVVGLGSWGTRNPVETTATNNANSLAPTHSLASYGLPYVYTGSAWDHRPNQGKFQEPRGFENLTAMFGVARSKRVPFLQLATWNDRAEGTNFEVSTKRGWCLLDITGYYAAWHRFGQPLPIVRDALHLAHRPMQAPTYSPQPTYTANTAVYTKRMVRTGSTVEANLFSVLVWATASAQVSLTVGGTAQTLTYGSATGTSVTVPAGVSVVQATLKAAAANTVTATLKRSGTTVATVTSPYAVNYTTQYVQDLDYYVVGSLANPRTT